MAYLVYTVVFFCLMLFQTTVIPALFNYANTYDLLIILIIYIGFFRSAAESIPVVLLLGLIMDSISGGAFGVYTTTYLWLYAVVAVVIQYLHVDSRFLLFAAIIAGVLWENTVVLTTVFIKDFVAEFSVDYIKTIVAQVFWAALTGPVVFYLIKNFHAACDMVTQKILHAKEHKSDF